MSVKRHTVEVNYEARQTLSAYVVVKPATTGNGVLLHDTATAYIKGITQDASIGGTGTAVLVAIGGTAKAQAGASVSSGSLLTVQTATGYVIEVTTSVLNTTSTVIPRTVGLANGKGSTNALIEVDFAPSNIRVVFA
jgi:hypothetical protein